ncbi:MAG TPA: VWA domain-containing protein [Vicinamibacterales bacterium]|nr:VWA domain-containing protein [Vicinamibacterales bacterium]
MVLRLAAAAAAIHLLAQQPPFRAETRLVVLQVSVEDRRGEPVTDLEQSAFTVYENGVRQPIALFRRDDIPVSMGLLIDNSGSMRSRRAQVESAALALAAASNADDEIFVLNFADRPRIDVPFTSDPRVLEAQIARVDAIGGTALRDAVAAGSDYVRGGRRDRRVLVVITDGADNASEASLDEALAHAERAGIVVFAIGLSDNSHARRDLDRLTQRTGGAALYPMDDVQRAALDIAHRIRTQYTVAYAPARQELDGSYRTVKVSVAATGHPRVRTRNGYWATR